MVTHGSNVVAGGMRTLRRLPVFCAVGMAMGFAAAAQAEPATCTYQTYEWNTVQRQAVNVRTVRKSYSQLTTEERDVASGCTVCEEDQVALTLPNGVATRICQKLAPAFKRALQAAEQQGQRLVELTGYRVGRTRGGVDERGNRLELSNHSYGVALDVNTSFNGLYDQCLTWGPACRLIKGGRWDPAQPESLTKDSPLVQAMRREGLQWGGQIAGKQKDFMHFSPSGY